MGSFIKCGVRTVELVVEKREVQKAGSNQQNDLGKIKGDKYYKTYILQKKEVYRSNSETTHHTLINKPHIDHKACCCLPLCSLYSKYSACTQEGNCVKQNKVLHEPSGTTEAGSTPSRIPITITHDEESIIISSVTSFNVLTCSLAYFLTSIF